MSHKFEQLVEKYHRLVLHLVRKYYGGRFLEEAEDISQEIWSKLWVHLKKNESQVVNFKSYLYRTVQTTLWDTVQRAERDPLSQSEELQLDNLQHDRSPQLVEAEIHSRQMVSVLLRSLKKEDQIIVKAYLQGLNYDEIAVLLGTSEGRIRNLLTRIKKKMARSHHASGT